MTGGLSYYISFFFNDTATTEIYTLSLHDALPILRIFHLVDGTIPSASLGRSMPVRAPRPASICPMKRSEEHTSELQSHLNLVCRLLLEKKKRYADRCKTTSVRASQTEADPSCVSR